MAAHNNKQAEAQGNYSCHIKSSASAYNDNIKYTYNTNKKWENNNNVIHTKARNMSISAYCSCRQTPNIRTHNKLKAYILKSAYTVT